MKKPLSTMKIIFFRSKVCPKKEKIPYEKEKNSLKHPWHYDPKHTL
jgi:hypothetical protein